MSRYLIKDGGNFTFTSSICVKMLVKIAEGELLHFFFLAAHFLHTSRKLGLLQ